MSIWSYIHLYGYESVFSLEGAFPKRPVEVSIEERWVVYHLFITLMIAFDQDG